MSLLRRAFPSAADSPPTRGVAGAAAGDGGLVPHTRSGAPTAEATANIIIRAIAMRLGTLPPVVYERDDRTRRPVRSPEFATSGGNRTAASTASTSGARRSPTSRAGASASSGSAASAPSSPAST